MSLDSLTLRHTRGRPGGAMSCLSSPRALVRGTRGNARASARLTRACRSTTRSKTRDAFVSIVASADEPPESSSSRDARLESARVPRRAALTYPALALGAAMVASVPGGARADETAADDSMVAALEASPVVEIPPEVGLAIDAGAPELGAPPAAADSDLNASVVGDVRLSRYVDEQSGYSVLVPIDWARDQPMANTPEFHPVSEYGGRRFRVEVAPVGRVPGGGQRLLSLVDSETESTVGAGFESPDNYAAVEATKFAPVKGTRAAEVAAKGPGGAVSEILAASASADGRYYYYEYRTDGIYPLRFFGAVAIGPGQMGSARKLSRRDIVKVTCQVPEKDASEADYELLRAVARSFQTETALP